MIDLSIQERIAKLIDGDIPILLTHRTTRVGSPPPLLLDTRSQTSGTPRDRRLTQCEQRQVVNRLHRAREEMESNRSLLKELYERDELGEPTRRMNPKSAELSKNLKPISERFYRILEKKEEKLEKIRNERNREEESNFTFKPKINEFEFKLKSSIERRKIRKIDEILQENKIRENSELTFHPRIDPISHRRASRRNRSGVFERMERDVECRRDRIAKLNESEEQLGHPPGPVRRVTNQSVIQRLYPKQTREVNETGKSFTSRRIDNSVISFDDFVTSAILRPRTTGLVPPPPPAAVVKREESLTDSFVYRPMPICRSPPRRMETPPTVVRSSRFDFSAVFD
jgi:hypothetical protein